MPEGNRGEGENPLAARLRAAGAGLREAPFGVLVLAGLLAVLGTGMLVAALYLLGGGAVGALALLSLGAGPLLIYFAVQLARRAHWAWLAAVLLLVLLVLSSAIRALVAPRDPGAALAEIAVEALFLVYLLRPHVRRAFGRAG